MDGERKVPVFNRILRTSSNGAELEQEKNARRSRGDVQRIELNVAVSLRLL
jgi:hypothetical protein